MNRNKPLIGKTAFVTGSARGLGKAIAEELSRLGANLVIHGSEEKSPQKFSLTKNDHTMTSLAAEMSRVFKNEVLPVWGDLRSESVVKKIVAKIIKKFGNIDILVCSAGGNISQQGTDINRMGKPTQDDALHISVQDFSSVMDRNLLAAFLCCREIAPQMIERKWGRIVTIGSRFGVLGGSDVCIYRVAKAALHMYTRCLADQLRPHNIPVNCVAPGPIGTERLQFIRPDLFDKNKNENPNNLERIPLPSEIAPFIGFLCTGGGDFISGQIFRFDRGVHLFPI